MPKVIGLDYGAKRTGIAMSDDRAVIAMPLETVETSKLLEYLSTILLREKIEVIVVGEAKRLNGQVSEITIEQEKMVDKIRRQFPELKIERINEMFTSSMAQQAMISGGFKKSDRATKGNLDKISAAIILQSYLDYRK